MDGTLCRGAPHFVIWIISLQHIYIDGWNIVLGDQARSPRSLLGRAEPMTRQIR
jgi:hypothetical protein